MTRSDLMARVLRPYKEHCRYLRSAAVTSRDGLAAARCEFTIPQSCYIDDTGHLNSVEANICYNQMMYYLVARSVRESLMDGLKDWTMEDYWKRQLPDILIARFAGNFRKPINARAFSGEMEFHSVARRSPGGAAPFIVAETSYRYWDDHGGRCDGEVTLALVNIPEMETA